MGSDWGCDEMVKRISCRVVRSVPLSRGSSRWRDIDYSHGEHHRTGSAAASDAARANNSVVYTSRLVTAREFADNGVAGQILDFCA
jgi:hypothetical protein